MGMTRCSCTATVLQAHLCVAHQSKWGLVLFLTAHSTVPSDWHGPLFIHSNKHIVCNVVVHQSNVDLLWDPRVALMVPQQALELVRLPFLYGCKMAISETVTAGHFVFVFYGPAQSCNKVLQ